MTKKYNILKDIMDRNGYSMQEFAELLGITRAGLYQVLLQNPIRHKYLEKIKHLLTDEDIKNNNTSIIMNTPIINHHQTNCIKYNNTQQNNNIASINYYQSINDFAQNKNKTIKQCDIQLFQILTNNNQISDFSKIVICCQDDKTLIIDTSKTTPSEQQCLYVVKNNIDANNSTCFVAEIKRNVLNNKIIMKLEDGTESEFLNTCTILGKVIK